LFWHKSIILPVKFTWPLKSCQKKHGRFCAIGCFVLWINGLRRNHLSFHLTFMSFCVKTKGRKTPSRSDTLLLSKTYVYNGKKKLCGCRRGFVSTLSWHKVEPTSRLYKYSSKLHAPLRYLNQTRKRR
jgi:hypothetical protein